MHVLCVSVEQHTVEPQYNEPPYDKVLGITNDFLYHSNGKIYEKEPQNNKTSLYAMSNSRQCWPAVSHIFEDALIAS